MKTHVMIDLETLSLDNKALILSIGAVKFDPNAPLDLAGKHQLIDAFYVCIDPRSAQQFGGHIDASTVMWWLSDERNLARHALLGGMQHDLPTALEAFRMWYGTDSLPTWGNGAAFDNVVLKNAYAALGEKAPWSYKDDMCFRTIRALAPSIEAVQVGTAHQALDDATAQACQMQDILRHIGWSI